MYLRLFSVDSPVSTVMDLWGRKVYLCSPIGVMGRGWAIRGNSQRFSYAKSCLAARSFRCCKCVCVCVCVCTHMKVKALVTRLCLTLCDPMDCSPPGSSVHEILQARILEWVAISLLQRIFPTERLNLALPHCRQILYHLSHQGSHMYKEAGESITNIYIDI